MKIVYKMLKNIDIFSYSFSIKFLVVLISTSDKYNYMDLSSTRINYYSYLPVLYLSNVSSQSIELKGF